LDFILKLRNGVLCFDVLRLFQFEVILKVAPLIFVADDNESLANFLARQLREWGYRTVTYLSKSLLMQRFPQEQPDLVLLDLQFGKDDGIGVMRDLLKIEPCLSIVLLTGHGSIETAVEAIRHGAYDFLTKPPDLQRLRLTLEHAIEKRLLSKRVEQLKKLTEQQDPSRRLWGDSPALKRLRELIESIAPTDVTALIQGESGTGKELVARAIHDQSRRSHGPFVPVNMAALPRELVESTLFGHEKGAFTGADQVRIGCCEGADGGTLFLDEIGEMDLDIQAKLLRFLQEREIQRVGSSRTRAVNVRIVAATNRDLQDQVKRGRFREDLFYRLQVVPLDVPTLRERRGDVPLLVTRFLERAVARHGKDVAGFTPEALVLLTNYDWPGNIRQLENLVERLVILSRTSEIGYDDLPEEIRTFAATTTPSAVGLSHLKVIPIEQVEKRAILEALKKSNGNVRDAAKLLGLGQATVYRKIKGYGVHSRDYLQEGLTIAELPVVG